MRPPDVLAYADGLAAMIELHVRGADADALALFVSQTRAPVDKEGRLSELIAVRDFVANWKSSHGCRDCGFRGTVKGQLEYDHTPELAEVFGPKRFDIGKPGPRSRPEVVHEMLKCEVVCVNCHRLRTALRRRTMPGRSRRRCSECGFVSQVDGQFVRSQGVCANCNREIQAAETETRRLESMGAL